MAIRNGNGCIFFFKDAQIERTTDTNTNALYVVYIQSVNVKTIRMEITHCIRMQTSRDQRVAVPSVIRNDLSMYLMFLLLPKGVIFFFFFNLMFETISSLFRSVNALRLKPPTTYR